MPRDDFSDVAQPGQPHDIEALFKNLPSDPKVQGEIIRAALAYEDDHEARPL